MPFQLTGSNFDSVFNTTEFYNYNLNLFGLQLQTLNINTLSTEDKLKNKKILYRPQLNKIKN
jgi:hypothetical protein